MNDEEVSFLKKALDGQNYDMAILFTHFVSWAANAKHIRKPDPNANKMVEDWKSIIIPVLKTGRVSAVFSGDEGVYRNTYFTYFDEIPHIASGWHSDTKKLSADFLSIKVINENELSVTRYGITEQGINKLEFEPL